MLYNIHSDRNALAKKKRNGGRLMKRTTGREQGHGKSYSASAPCEIKVSTNKKYYTARTAEYILRDFSGLGSIVIYH